MACNLFVNNETMTNMYASQILHFVPQDLQTHHHHHHHYHHHHHHHHHHHLLHHHHFERFWSLGWFKERKYRPLQIILLQVETRFWRKCHLLPRERMSKMSILSSLTYQVIWATSGRPHYKGNRRGMYQSVLEKKQFYESHCKNAKTEDF